MNKISYDSVNKQCIMNIIILLNSHDSVNKHLSNQKHRHESLNEERGIFIIRSHLNLFRIMLNDIEMYMKKRMNVKREGKKKLMRSKPR